MMSQSDHSRKRKDKLKSNAKPNSGTKSKRKSTTNRWRASETNDKISKKKEDSWLSRLTNSALTIARKTTGGSIKIGRTILKNQDQIKLMMAAGQSLKDLREVAGLTVHELSDAINLKDKSLLEAAENGTATLSFELILRLASLLARNDPVPFIIKFTRTYNPELWQILNDWGLGRIPLQYERERKFINIYRRHDAARALSDEGFEKVLAFTNNAFEMALHFIAESENIQVEAVTDNEFKEAAKSTSYTAKPGSDANSAPASDKKSEPDSNR